jgi:hypothetical protein
LLILVLTASAAAAQGRTAPCAECVALVIEPREANSFSGPLNGARIAVKIRAGAEHTAIATLSDIRDTGGRPGLVVTGLPSQPLAAEPIRVAQDVFLDITSLETEAPLPIDETAFRLRSRFAELRGQSPEMTLGLVATATQRQQLLDRDIAPYLDVIVEPAHDGSRQPDWPTAGFLYASIAVANADAAPRTSSRSRLLLWSAPQDRVEADWLVRDLSRTMRLLVADLIPGGASEVWCGGTPVATYVNPRTLDVIAFAPGCSEATIEVKRDAQRAERVTLSHGVVVRVPAAAGQFADDVNVVGARELTVEEIVARHQAAAARQRSLVKTLISSGAMTLTFEAPGFAAPVAISSETVIFQREGSTAIAQRSVRVNGIEFDGGRVPRLPIIEPERVASPPLAITLSDLYRYSLTGREPCGSATCYIVKFEPVDGKRALFRGRAWIAADDFAMVRVAATQTGLRGPIVSSEQIDEFVREREGIWLLARSDVRQIYEGAAHRTPIHRLLAVTAHEVNPLDFDARRQSAYNSATVMLRDTADGFRYLQRRPDAVARGAEPALTGPANRMRTLVTGLIVDPNISRPLPFAGLSYVDFDLFGTGMQLNAFFGGTYGQLAFLVPSIGNTRWRLAGRAFGIATSFNDRAFDQGHEIYEHNITQRPAHASIWTLRPLTTRLTVRAGYEMDYTQFGASDLTATTFTVPADQVAHSFRLAIEGQRAGWNGSVWWAGSRRSGWRPWGTGSADFHPRHMDYQRFGVTLTRPFVLTPGLVARVEGAWMDGHDLDRFSRYAFGTFDNRLRGYPSALIRYDRGGVARGALAWAAGRRLRVDGFVDTAYVLDPGFGPDLRSYSGVGGAIEAPAPFGMLAGVEWGYGFQGVNASGRRGTQVLRITAFKLF